MAKMMTHSTQILRINVSDHKLRGLPAGGTKHTLVQGNENKVEKILNSQKFVGSEDRSKGLDAPVFLVLKAAPPPLLPDGCDDVETDEEDGGTYFAFIHFVIQQVRQWLQRSATCTQGSGPPLCG